MSPPNIRLFLAAALIFFRVANAALAQDPAPSASAEPPLAASAPRPPLAPTPVPTPSIVYSIRDPSAIDHFRTNASATRAMVDQLVRATTGQPEIGKAWASLVAPGDRVGIKISASGGELFTTHRDVVNAIVDGLTAAGVPRNNVIVWDRDLAAVERGGYRPGREAYRVVGIEPRDGYDAKGELTAPLLGRLVWGDLGFIPKRGENPIAVDSKNASNVSHIAKVLTTDVTKVINVPVLSQSETTGIAGALHNMTLPNIDNWRRFLQYEQISASAMAELYTDPRIAGKVVLHLMDGLVSVYAGGPASSPNFAVHTGTLLASKDPVALDTIALQRLERLRASAQMPAIGTRAVHVQAAGQLGLGTADPRRIEVREVRR